MFKPKQIDLRHWRNSCKAGSVPKTDSSRHKSTLPHNTSQCLHPTIPRWPKLLQIYTPSRTLRSTADARKLKIPLFKKKYSGQRSFSYQGPVTWNNLLSPFATHKHTPHLSHSWKPTCFPKPSNRTQFLMLFVFDFQSWDVSMVHI